MKKEEIISSFKQILKDHHIENIDKITDNTKMSEDLNIDSLDLVEIVMEAEEKFDITIPEAEMSNLKTFGELITFIDKEIKGAKDSTPKEEDKKKKEGRGRG